MVVAAWLRGIVVHGGNSAAIARSNYVISFADLCLLLGLLFAFGTLILKVIEVSRDK